MSDLDLAIDYECASETRDRKKIAGERKLGSKCQHSPCIEIFSELIVSPHCYLSFASIGNPGTQDFRR